MFVIVVGVLMLFKLSEKILLIVICFVELFYEVGFFGLMFSVFVGGIKEVVELFLGDECIELVLFMGGIVVGKCIVYFVGYKKICLELGGNSFLLILEDVDFDLVVKFVCEGVFWNSG